MDVLTMMHDYSVSVDRMVKSSTKENWLLISGVDCMTQSSCVHRIEASVDSVSVFFA